jgi:hypothetical protein
MSENHKLGFDREASFRNVTAPKENQLMKTRYIAVILLALASLGVAPQMAAQAPADSSSSSSGVEAATVPQPVSHYTRPTAKVEFHNYLFDTFGPYPIVGAGITAGINQAYKTPPEWQQGAEGYGKRYASVFGIAGVSTTTRYAVAKAFGEDTLYYRCECTGIFPRLRHAVVSTFTSRRGGDGHRVFSFPALVAPYAGTMTAVYAWYPGRYNASDGFRMGNYSLLGYAGGNIALEFIYSGPHSWISRMHLNNGHGAKESLH